MEYVLYTIFFLSCIFLVIFILLQPGKTDAGALFTSNISQSAFAPRGTATVLQKATITAAALFMLSALLLSMPALQGNVSVLSSNPETSTETPAITDTNTNANAAVNANTNSATSVDSNAAANTNAATTNNAPTNTANTANTNK